MSRLIDADELENSLGCSDRDIYVKECLREAPSVVAEPKKGKWIPTTETQEGQIGWQVYKCSNCSHYRCKPMNYCEVCGSKMTRERHESN